MKSTSDLTQSRLFFQSENKWLPCFTAVNRDGSPIATSDTQLCRENLHLIVEVDVNQLVNTDLTNGSRRIVLEHSQQGRLPGGSAIGNIPRMNAESRNNPRIVLGYPRHFLPIALGRATAQDVRDTASICTINDGLGCICISLVLKMGMRIEENQALPPFSSLVNRL